MYEFKQLDLFSGLGCFAIAGAVNGIETEAFCEINEDCARFLEYSWRKPVHRDVKKLNGRQYRGIWSVVGGPPCQAASRAGKQRGAADDRWLWPEAIRIVGEAQPACFVFENPPGIEDVGLDGVLSDLESLNYETAPIEIPACAVDAPQGRARIWIVGYAKSLDRGLLLQPRRSQQADSESSGAIEGGALGYTGSLPAGPREPGRSQEGQKTFLSLQNSPMADADRPGLAQRESQRGNNGEKLQTTQRGDSSCGLWSDYIWIPCRDGKFRRSKPGIRGLADGPSVGLLTALGNSLVWPVAAQILGAMKRSFEEAIREQMK